MSAFTSKAVVITYPGKHGSITAPARSAEFSVLDAADLDSDDGYCGGGPKKRRRLTHLTPDEKLLRRKLKNRVAAQTARDRKKALMVELEEKLSALEEENRLLKLQNFSLKEASNSLVKENAILRSHLAHVPLPTTKTDSETTSTVSSAEGAGSESVSMVGRCGYSQSGNFLGMPQEVTDDRKCEWLQMQTAPSFPHSSARPVSGSRSSAVVGLSAAELESLNELISIDHVYVKPQPTHARGGKEEHHKSTTVVYVQGNNYDIDPAQQKRSTELPAIKRRSVDEVTHGPVSQAEPNIPSNTGDIKFNKINPNFPDSSLYTSLSSLPAHLDVSDINDDLISSLSDSNVETSLNFLQDFDFTTLESNTKTHVANGHNSNICNNAVPDSRQTDEVLHDELNASKLFDEIYEHYLSIKSSSSPDSSCLSDSGISSDLDILSPSSIDESLHDDIMWHETSFADLFPDLQ